MRASTQTFICKFLLKTNKRQEKEINKKLDIGRKIYNSLLNFYLKKLKQLEQDKEYKYINRLIKEKNNFLNNVKTEEETNENKEKRVKKKKGENDKIKNDLKELYNKRTSLINKYMVRDDLINHKTNKKYTFSSFVFLFDVAKIQKIYKDNISSSEAQAISENLYKSFEKYFFGNGKKIYHKKYNDFNSIRNKKNTLGMRIINNEYLSWGDLKIKLKIHKNDYFAMESLTHKIKYPQIIRECIRGKNKYYVNIYFEGIPPKKYDKNGNEKLSLGDGKVGIDIGTSTLAYASNDKVKLTELAPKTQIHEDKIMKLKRKINRSRIINNPLNFNKNGTSKKGKLKWVYSNHYKKLRKQLKEEFRKQKVVRKLQHEELSNEILKQGNEFLVEKMSFKGLQKRALKTEVNSKGKYKRKGRFGKSIANRGPKMLLSILERKLSYFNKEIEYVNTNKIKASQYNHENDDYEKKSLNNRWNDINGKKVQRDLYSAFIIQNVNEDGESINKKSMEVGFDHFIEMHDKEIERLKNINENHKLPKCIGL